MTYNYLEVDTEELKRAGVGFQTGAGQLEAIFNRLSSALSAEGECWGSDETGKTFAAGYKEPATTTLDSFPKLKEGLEGIKKGVDQMAKTYKAAEDASELK
ncbi:type VII secretion system (Wss) protein ESAT-6 [Actinomadura hallensis]|uniref:Type VII secretion system (Wss) protein ESAT-6 n=1 Tax=Actinomadura hallensis TaxID=337895 RepID=A0A543I9G1_9ACTN|nr:WXG100 family type VII secretion target [Actinomadura hallensis]TQM67211.1 type VII secretion system (Wss) protein ESAT-6 [Actinomadura hallensis]